MLFTMAGDFYSLWDRIITPFDPLLRLQQDTVVWEYSQSIGRYFVYLPHVVYHGAVLIFSTVFPPGIANTLVFTILFFLCGLNMYNLIRRFNPFKDKMLIPLIAALFYMFNQFWSFRLFTAPGLIFILAFLPLLISMIIRILDDGFKDKVQLLKRLIYFSFILFIMTPAFTEIAAGLISAFFVLSVTLIYAVLEKKTRIFVVLILMLSIVTILVNMWWAIPTLTHSTVEEALGREGQYLTDSIATLKLSTRTATYSNILKSFVFYEYVAPEDMGSGNTLVVRPAFEGFYYSTFIASILFMIPLLIIVGFLFGNPEVKKAYLIFFLPLIFFIPIFFAGFNAPFSALVMWLVKTNPLFVFRRASVYSFIIQFVYSVGLAFSFAALHSRFKSRLHKNIVVGLFSVVFLLLAMPQLLLQTPKVDMYDYNSTRIPVSLKTKIPAYVEDSIRYLNSQYDKGGAIVLPKVGSMRAYDWDKGYFGFDPYYLTLNRPVLTHYRYGFMYPNDQIYDLAVQMIKYNDTESFSEVLNANDMDYIIFVNDSLQWGAKKINKTQIERFLFGNPNLKLVAQFGPHYIFRTDDKARLFYVTSHSRYIKPINRDISLADLVVSNSIEHKFLSFYDDNLVLSYNYTQDRIDKNHFGAPFRTNIYVTPEFSLLAISFRDTEEAKMRVACQTDNGLYYLRNFEIRNDEILETVDGYTNRGYILADCPQDSEISIILSVQNVETPANYEILIRNVKLSVHAEFTSITDTLNLLIKDQELFKTVYVEGEADIIDLENNALKYTIQKISPVRYRATFTGMSNEFIFASTIPYSKDWILKPLVGDVDVKKLKINSGYNGWKIKSDSDVVSLDLYYQKQDLANILMTLTGIYLFAALCILISLLVVQIVRKK